jgi:FkbM family methyltransferase
MTRKIRLFRSSRVQQSPERARLRCTFLAPLFCPKNGGKFTQLFAFIAKTKYGLFAVDPEDCGFGLHLLRQSSYGKVEIENLKQYIKSESAVLIVGAHIGYLAIPLSKCCKKVVAIEANPITYKLLTINISLNGVSNCQAINIAANDKCESIDFLLSRANTGGSKRVPIIKDYIYYYDKPQTVSVSAVSLDDYLNEKGFDLIIMDIEGSEYFALKGMQEILEKSKVLVVEFLPHHLRNVGGVSVEEFLAVIESHFSTLIIPSKQLKVDKLKFKESLKEMYDKDLGDEGLIFEKCYQDAELVGNSAVLRGLR